MTHYGLPQSGVDPSFAAVQRQAAELDALRAENTQLRAELETLKRQLTDAVLSLPPADDLDV